MDHDRLCRIGGRHLDPARLGNRGGEVDEGSDLAGVEWGGVRTHIVCVG
jgi:hypothetical protein